MGNSKEYESSSMQVQKEQVNLQRVLTLLSPQYFSFLSTARDLFLESQEHLTLRSMLMRENFAILSSSQPSSKTDGSEGKVVGSVVLVTIGDNVGEFVEGGVGLAVLES